MENKSTIYAATSSTTTVLTDWNTNTAPSHKTVGTAVLEISLERQTASSGFNSSHPRQVQRHVFQDFTHGKEYRTLFSKFL